MEIVNIINNSDFKNKHTLKEVFEYKSISEYNFEVKSDFVIESDTDNRIKFVKIKGEIYINSNNENLISKAVVYFPEKKYGVEFINTNNKYQIEIIYEMINLKEYFNLVIFDKFNKMISSSTYVFNQKKIIPYPLIKKNISPIKVKSNVEKVGEDIIFTSKCSDGYEDVEIHHIWQNLGQHEVKVPEKIKDKDELFISKKSVNEMCKGIWMLIAIDQKQRLIDQVIISI